MSGYDIISLQRSEKFLEKREVVDRRIVPIGYNQVIGEDVLSLAGRLDTILGIIQKGVQIWGIL